MNTVTKKVNSPSAQDRLMALEVERARLLKLVAEEKAQNVNKVSQFIRTLPSALGVPTLTDVYNLIKQIEKGSFGSAVSSIGSRTRTRTVLKAEQKAALLAEYLAGGPENSRKKLIERYNISYGNLQNILHAAGFTHPHNTHAPITTMTPATDTQHAA